MHLEDQNDCQHIHSTNGSQVTGGDLFEYQIIVIRSAGPTHPPWAPAPRQHRDTSLRISEIQVCVSN